MKNKLIINSIALGLLSVSSLSFADQPVKADVPNAYGLKATDDGEGGCKSMRKGEKSEWQQKREAWKKMSPEEKKSQFLQHANARVEKDLQQGVITKEESATLLSANQIIANKLLPQWEKKRAENHTDKVQQGNSMGMPK